MKKFSFVFLLTFIITIHSQPTTNSHTKNFVIINPTDTPEQIISKAANVVPTPQQHDWQKVEFTAFVHFGMNIFTSNEWGAGKEDEKLFPRKELQANAKNAEKKPNKSTLAKASRKLQR